MRHIETYNSPGETKIKMTEKQVFDFARESFGFICKSVKLLREDWNGYTVYCPYFSVSLAAGLPPLILEKDNKLSIKQDYECLELLKQTSS